MPEGWGIQGLRFAKPEGEEPYQYICATDAECEQECMERRPDDEDPCDT
jgi:hypothetical protein